MVLETVTALEAVVVVTDCTSAPSSTEYHDYCFHDLERVRTSTTTTALEAAAVFLRGVVVNLP